MKQITLFIFLVLFSLTGISQKLNKLGKIDLEELPTAPEFQVRKIDGVYKVFKDSFIFVGNSYYSIPEGFITSLESVDDEKDYIKHYNTDGKLLATILSDRIINLKLSENGMQLVFYNTENIIDINLSNYEIDTLSGSFVYTFLGNDLIYYDSKNKEIIYKGFKILIEDYPNQFLVYNDDILVFTKKLIYKLSGGNLIVLHSLKGNFFDAKIVNNEFYFVDKVEKRKSESFTLYKTSDFNKFMIIDKLDDLNQ
jgi:hypothetical protein